MIAATKTKIEPGRLLIDGQWSDGAKKFDTINPASGEVLTQIVEASAEDVDRAVSAARKAFEERGGPWRKMSASERGRLLWKLADLIEKNIDELVANLTQTFRRLRQSSIDEELFDVLSGYESLSTVQTRRGPK